MTTIPHPAVPPLDDDLADRIADLRGIHRGIDLILDGARHLALSELTLDQTQTLLSTIAGNGGVDVLDVLAQLVRRLTDPAQNPSLRALDPDVQKAVQRLGERHAYETAAYTPRDCPPEAAALIDGLPPATHAAITPTQEHTS
ncbi:MULTISPECIES: hypothetical protein [Streptomyces]|uniref:Uncharacterized protein n=1 Tax=Streptomyces fradiae ATCC 10745 = DSM 40063 TaxID=1319510 RepID=A0A1Y2NNM4_STRFR|nr:MULTISPECIES: hypothetical protein [Streptomyces]KAF0646309.1 hypothetical protein K701_29535 [Streptomyces fradiae ATCC 10745 = DSM 40063]OSY49093.1 hypothetical protein BG846_05332 [Streptomyces fradiae ATCC 10745 = DSM 40063]